MQEYTFVMEKQLLRNPMLVLLLENSVRCAVLCTCRRADQKARVSLSLRSSCILPQGGERNALVNTPPLPPARTQAPAGGARDQRAAVHALLHDAVDALHGGAVLLPQPADHHVRLPGRRGGRQPAGAHAAPHGGSR